MDPQTDNSDNSTPQPTPEPPKSPYPPPREALLVWGIALLATLLLGAFAAATSKIGLFAAELFFLVPPIFYLRYRGYNIRRCLRWNSVPFTALLSTLLIGLSLVILLDEADRLMNLVFPMPDSIQKVLMGFFTFNTWQDYLVIGLGAVVIAAVCEESLFRGFMQISFEAHGTVTWAVLFTALLFSLAHFNPWWMVQILILGVFLGFISWRSASSIPGMIVHGLNNGLALLAGGDTTGAGWSWYNSGHHVAPAVLIAAGALLFLGLKFFLRATEKSFLEDVIPDEAPAA